ncbi:hypothetical protein E1287_02005 [Actinomadura sp. KC06]|uniref:hypothetical protein n=1 Tax=Actinomadura sp. KC06 TaxID=2530369 RepID=UPI001044BE19|nr:hypothetical protein [Actinomadura sp. KC06]TDD39974.1 hypothetical protein E1287_02005 [Actinomadura sp. KC06]
MSEPNPVPPTFAEELAGRRHPTVGVWNRLEGRPRTADFERALRVEVRDPLWMLTRQWQLGEFRGTDAGSPVTATYSVSPSRPTRFRPHGGPPEDLPTDRPLETMAERRLLPFAFGDEEIAFDLRVMIGHRWLKLLGKHNLLGLDLFRFERQYIAKYPIQLPDPEHPAKEDTARLAHPEVWATMQTIAGRRMDGYLLYRHIKGGGNAADGINGLLHRATLNSLGKRLVAWFDALIDQPTGVTPERPDGDATWDPRRLEHRFSVSASVPGGEKVVTAQEYPGGELDWHAFSVDPGPPLGGTRPPEKTLSRTVFPAPVRFSGMPLPRWWAIEDGRTNFAAVRPDSTDLARLIFLEFALVFSNDWYQLPCDLPAGTMNKIRGLVVTDVFGERLWITPAGAGDDEDQRRWSMFTLDTIGADHVPADTDLLLPPSVPKVAEGPALEEVLLIRDENANLVWGIEQTVRMPTGEPRRGSEAAAEALAFRQRHAEPTPDEEDPPRAPLSYQAMNAIPEHWIPFIPVRVPGDNREIQLQRAAMPSVVDGRPVPARTTLLRHGFDAGTQYFVNEEEVPQAGTRLSVAFNRTRWRDGRVVLWLSAHRGVGRGEASSGLRFDTLINTPTTPTEALRGS